MERATRARRRTARGGRAALLAAALALVAAGCAGRSQPAQDGASWTDGWWISDGGALPPPPDSARPPDVGQGVQDGAAPGAYTVQVIYLVPADAPHKPEYSSALRAAAEHLRIWLGHALGERRSITLADPAVQVLVSTHPAAWFATSARSADQSTWYHHNVIDDAANAGVSRKAKDRLWLIYADAPAGCGQWNWGFFPVAVYTRNDLLGLVGQAPRKCTGELDPLEPKCRWVGGMALLMSFALGIGQPESCLKKEPGCPAQTLTWNGFRSYPLTEYTEADAAKLRASPFIAPVELPEALPACN